MTEKEWNSIPNGRLFRTEWDDTYMYYVKMDNENVVIFGVDGFPVWQEAKGLINKKDEPLDKIYTIEEIKELF